MYFSDRVNQSKQVAIDLTWFSDFGQVIQQTFTKTRMR
jgi:hypothetical protein